MPTLDTNDLPPCESRGLRVLIVEDEMLIAMLLEDILTDLGCEVVGIASSASAALIATASTRVDIALMDVDISGPVDGVGAASALLERHGVRSVFVTARSDAEFRARAGAAGALGFVDKPYRTVDIDGALRRARPSLPTLALAA